MCIATRTTGCEIQERYAYDAYGWPEILTAAFAARAASDVDWQDLYTGRYLDGETGVMYYRNRYSSTESGAFISRDPIDWLLKDGYKLDKNKTCITIKLTEYLDWQKTRSSG